MSRRLAHIVSANRVCRGVVVSDIRFGFVRSTGPFLTRVPYALLKAVDKVSARTLKSASEISFAKCFGIQHDKMGIYDSCGHFGNFGNMFCYHTSRYTRSHNGPLVLYEQQENKQRHCQRKGNALVS